ncbi:MAG: diaminopimelate dehydrogenase [Defluviitaleaceae bacterium]|nr:diaminopimelate dehydrogenase [Defluviitaleaceae bacterium]
MEKINVAVVGWGNVGKQAVKAVNAAPDMELVGVVRRSVSGDSARAGHVRAVEDIKELGKVDVALLCTPTRAVEEEASKYLAMGISTVDSFDIHSGIVDLRGKLGPIAKANGVVSVVAAGWDPGSDSVVRTLMEAMSPGGITYTDFGPGMSMGHSVVARSVAGVADALSLTIPLGTGVHRRLVYVQLKEGASFEKVEADIKTDPYFRHDETRVMQVDDVQALVDMGHGVSMSRKGVSGQTHNQMLQFNMRINNPALTSQVMASCARACKRLPPGCYTMIEIPVVDLLPGEREGHIHRLV